MAPGSHVHASGGIGLAGSGCSCHVSLGQLAGHLGELSRSLSDWDCTTFGSVRKTLAQLRKDLERIRGQSIGAGPPNEERHLMKQISELLSREEVMEK